MKREENQTVEYKESWHEKYLAWTNKTSWRVFRHMIDRINMIRGVRGLSWSAEWCATKSLVVRSPNSVNPVNDVSKTTSTRKAHGA